MLLILLEKLAKLAKLLLEIYVICYIGTVRRPLLKIKISLAPTKKRGHIMYYIGNEEIGNAHRRKNSNQIC